MAGDETQEITVEVDAKIAERIARRLRLIEQMTELSAEEAAGRYLTHGILHHEEAIYG